MSYDNWKMTNPADEVLGPGPLDRGSAAGTAAPKILVAYWKKPIAFRIFDWSAVYDGDEPDDFGRQRIGYGETEAEAVADLIDNYPREGS